MTTNTQTKNIKKAIAQIMKLLPDNDKDENITTIKKKLNSIEKKAVNIRNTHAAQIKLLEAKIQTYEQTPSATNIINKLETLATNRDILEAFESMHSTTERLAGNTKQTIQEHISAVKTSVESVGKTVVAKMTQPQIMPTINTHAAAPRPLYSELAERTLILKPIDPKSGQEVRKDLNAANVALPVAAVKQVHNTRTAVELVCSDATSKQHTKRFLQSHQTLNKKYNILQKQVSKHRLIVFGVPEHLDEHYISDTLTQTFVLQDGSVTILTKVKCKYEKHLNWIILVDEATALKMVHSQGATFSHKFCRIRPHTAMPRCKNCQRIGHASSRCKFTVPSCGTCCNPHTEQEDCKGAQCVNCHNSNLQHKTSHDVHHKPGDPKCPTYRATYIRERERIDRIFRRDSPAPPENNAHTPRLADAEATRSQSRRRQSSRPSRKPASSTQNQQGGSVERAPGEGKRSPFFYKQNRQ